MHDTYHNAYKLCIKHNPKSIKSNVGTKHHQYIKYTKISKPSMSYKFKPNINHNHSVSNLTHNPKHKTITINKKIKMGINICVLYTTPPFCMHTPSHSYVVLPLTMCYCSPLFWHE